MVACGTDVLPGSAAPCLTFKEAASPVPVCDLFRLAAAWSPADQKRLERYRVIGFDGAGNPICLEQRSGVVVLLDHEDQFHTRQFVNTSVGQLAACLLAYMGERDSERFREALRRIDPAALAARSFWWHEAALLGTEPVPGTETDCGSM
jgi:hypothetical protein